MPLDPAAPKFFGFSEYLAALALMILVWTTTDVRSRFRIATAPIPLHWMSFGAIAFVGTATLLTDLWRAEGWLVPRGRLLTPAIWQALLGGLFLFIFLSWGWYAFVRPPQFSHRNARRFGSFLFSKTMQGNESDLAILSQELTRSIPNLIAAAPRLRQQDGQSSNEIHAEISISQGVAHDLLLLIGDPRICRAMVRSSPETIYVLFREIEKQKKLDLPIFQFCRNMVEAAIEERNSFLYHEVDGFDSGLLGYLRPVSHAIFGNHAIVHAADSLLDPDYRTMKRWSADQWEAYNRAVLITFSNYVDTDFRNHSFVLFRAFKAIGTAAFDIYKIDGLVDGAGWEEDSVQRLRASVNFCEEAIKILDSKGIPNNLRIRKTAPTYQRTAYDWLVDLMYACIDHASHVKQPRGLSWTIQHNSVWIEFFSGLHENTVAGRVILFKLRRKLYDEIREAETFPNYVNVRILGYCLNVMGLSPPISSYGRNWRALHKAVLAWTARNYAVLARQCPQVFADCLPDGLSYDEDRGRLVQTSQITAFRDEPKRVYLHLEAPSPRQAKQRVRSSRRPKRGTEDH